MRPVAIGAAPAVSLFDMEAHRSALIDGLGVART
jgi:hypothetical protein